MKILQAPPVSGSNAGLKPSKSTPEVLVSLLSPVLIAKLESFELSGVLLFSLCLRPKWWTGDICSDELSQPLVKITWSSAVLLKGRCFFWDWVYHSCFVFIVRIHLWHITDAHMVSCVGNISRKASHLCDVFSLAEISLTAVSALLLLNPCIFHCYNFFLIFFLRF